MADFLGGMLPLAAKVAWANPKPLDLIERGEAFVTPVAEVVHVGIELSGLRVRVQYNFELIRRGKWQLRPH